MRKVMTVLPLVLLLAGPAAAAGPTNPEYGLTVPSGQTAENECKLGYFDLCSGWVYWWTSFNGNDWIHMQTPPKVGVCFDLADCDGGCAECSEVSGVLWAWKRFSAYGRIDLEVYRADASGCPVGDPLGGHYDYGVDLSTPFQYFAFEGLDLPSETCKFVVMATIKTPGDCAPYSDGNDRNRVAGCEGAWRCTGHSFVYRSAVDYCQAKGTPEPLSVDLLGACPPNNRFLSEFITYAYVGCRGALKTEKNSWSEIKAKFR